MVKEDLLKRIEFHPGILGGKATIRGMRLSVEQLLASLAAGISEEELLEDYEGLTKEDLQAVLLYAAELVSEERVYSLAA
jgi:uncharacterized protein (DUF433 family)